MNRFKPLLYLLPALLLVPAFACAGDSVDEERKVARDGVVQIHNLRGEVHIAGWDKDAVHVEGELDDLATGFIFEVNGDETMIRVKMPEHDVNWGDGSDLRISMPTESRVEFSGVSTDVTVSGVEGGAVVRSVSGDIDLSDVANEVIVKSVSGDAVLDQLRGRTRISSVSGDLRLTLASTEVSADTVSGEIELALKDFDRLSTTTVSGDQDVSGQLNHGGDIQMKSVSGEIDLTLRGDVDAEITVKTGPGGDIVNDVTDDEPTEVFPARSMLDTTAGDGSGDIRISAVSGDVHLRKR